MTSGSLAKFPSKFSSFNHKVVHKNWNLILIPMKPGYFQTYLWRLLKFTKKSPNEQKISRPSSFSRLKKLIEKIEKFCFVCDQSQTVWDNRLKSFIKLGQKWLLFGITYIGLQIIDKKGIKRNSGFQSSQKNLSKHRHRKEKVMS